nr:hypothetical protein [uncultured Emticicia sp.]
MKWGKLKLFLINNQCSQAQTGLVAVVQLTDIVLVCEWNRCFFSIDGVVGTEIVPYLSR